MRSFDNVIAGQGIELTIAGMVIVFFVLALIALCIAAIPKLLQVINKIYPERAHPDHHDDFMPDVPPPPLSERDAAAVAYAWFVATTQASARESAS